jgi:hypothetical protein
MAILLCLNGKVGITRIGAFVEQTIALIILPGVDLNQEERYFWSGLFFFLLGTRRKAQGQEPFLESLQKN